MGAPSDFLAQLVEARFAALMAQGVLPATVPGMASLPPLQRLATVDRAASTIRRLAAQLPESTRALWLGNWCEWLVGSALDVEHAGAFLALLSTSAVQQK